MSKSLVAWIIGAMAVALVGLIVVQVYWLENALELKESRFKQAVHAALNAVVTKLEQQEMALTICRSLDTPAPDHSVHQAGNAAAAAAKDSGSAPRASARQAGVREEGSAAGGRVVHRFRRQGDSGVAHIQVAINRSYSDSAGLLLHHSEDIDIVETDSMPAWGAYSVRLLPDSAPGILAGADSARMKHWVHILQDNPGRVQKRLAMYSTVSLQMLNDIVTVRKSIEERINPRQLESLLSAELRQRGIDIPYEYEISARPRLQKVGNTAPAAAPLSVELFPHDIVGPGHYLHLAFPEQEAYIFNSMWSALGSSLAFILIIILSFGFTLFTLQRQKKLSDIKTDFINNMTHEFKTPIATISLAGEALKDPHISRDESRLQRFANIIYDENKRLERQVERVLQAAVLDRGDVRLDVDMVDIHELIGQAAAGLSLQVERRGGRIECRLLAAHAQVSADRVHITNVLYNLLDNANKYSPERPEICISTQDSGKGLLIEVSDRGIGMSREAQRSVFEKFFRVATGNLHDVKGFGLGLSYVKSIVEAHGGNVSVWSRLHKGSTFRVWLPLGTDKQEARA